MPLDHLKRPNPKTAAPKPAPPKAADTPPAPAKPTVTYKCGHKVGLAHVEASNCPGCKEAQRKANAAERRQEQDRTSSGREWPNRLPPGSAKTLTWTGTEWVGTLTIPAAGDRAGVTVSHKAPTERELCHGLHQLYVDRLNKPGPAATSGPSGPGVVA
jgi:hypothetical protein